jgi:arylsulfatase A-like enzyme
VQWGSATTAAAGVRFSVAIAGREVFARIVHRDGPSPDPGWFEERVPIPPGSGSDGRLAEIELRTEVVGPGDASTARPGWSQVRIVGERTIPRRTREAGPSVLVLLVDTLRADALGAYGAVPSPSPALDALAARGLVFEQCVAQAPWTLPSVASLFTGLLPGEHGLLEREVDLSAGRGTRPLYLPDGLPTLATAAQEAGITTIGIVSNPVVSRATNLDRGFETFVELGWDPRSGWASAAALNDEFLGWLDRNPGHRFLGYLHYMDIHGPYRPADRDRPSRAATVRSRLERGDVYQIGRDIESGELAPLAAEELRYLQGLYHAQIPGWDRELERLLRGLARAGVADSTIIVVLSDHGEELWEHGRVGHRRHLYDEVLRVPLVIAGPGLPSGRVPGQVQSIDVLPTVLALLGASAPAPVRGANLLAGPPTMAAISETVFGGREAAGAAGAFSVRTSEWKLIHGRGAFELYHLAADPGERVNCYGKPEQCPGRGPGRAGEPTAELLAAWRRAAAVAGASGAAITEAPGPSPGARLNDLLRVMGYTD